MVPVEFKHVHEPRSRTRLTKRGRLLVVLLVLVPVAALLVAGGLTVGHILKGGGGSADYAGPGTGQVIVEVKSGDTSTAIGQTLAKAEVVKSSGAFVDAAKKNSKATSIQPGFYALKLQMSGTGALNLMLTPSSLVQAKFTIPEGTSLKTALPLIVKGTQNTPITQITQAALETAVANPASLGLPSYANGSVEGFLFPATYQITPVMTATDVLKAMTARFAVAATKVDLVNGAQALKYTPLQVVTIASIIERETAAPADASKVARVFYNRLKAGLPLGSEFTVNYTGNDANSPYNTYTHKGFPPGPYDSPGEATLTAALHPADGPWLYFVTLKSGTQFVNTEAEFNKLEAQCKAEGGCK